MNGKKGHRTVTDLAIADVRADEFDALVIPGGYSPDKLRVNEGMVAFTRELVQSGKPVAAICHAGWMLAEADVARGRRVTSVRNIRTDLVNAGADWSTSRWSWTATSSRPAPRPTCQPSATRYWNNSNRGHAGRRQHEAHDDFTAAAECADQRSVTRQPLGTSSSACGQVHSAVPMGTPASATRRGPVSVAHPSWR